MSCFVVSDYHVSALVAWAIRHGLDLDASPDAVAHMLASANRRAYSERYAGRYDSELVPFGGLDYSAGADLAPVAIVKACDCLAYQCSDWSSWDQSDACLDLGEIRQVALQLTRGPWSPAEPDDGRPLPGYDAAAWSLDAPEPEPVDPVADRLAAALADMTGPELAALRAALAAVRGVSA